MKVIFRFKDKKLCPTFERDFKLTKPYHFSDKSLCYFTADFSQSIVTYVSHQTVKND